MRFGVPTVVLVKEDCSLVGYDTLCACSADMLEEFAASIFKVCTWHIFDCHPGYHHRHCSIHTAAWMDIPFWLSSNHCHRPIWVSTFPAPAKFCSIHLSQNSPSFCLLWPCGMPTLDAEGSHYVPRRRPEDRCITHSLPQHSSVLQGGSASVCNRSHLQLTPAHS